MSRKSDRRMFTPEAVNGLVLRKQHLTDDSRGEDVIQIIRDIGGLHGTSTTTPYLSLFSRMKDFKRESLDARLNEKRLAKVRCMRGTMYIMPTDTYPATFSALRRTFDLKPNPCKQYLGIGPDEYGVLSRSILDMVRSDGMTGNKAKASLRTSINVSRVMGLMCDRGLLARGMPEAGWTSNVYTYYPFSEYYPGMSLEMPELESRAWLIGMYLAAFGPATVDDIAWWTGLPKKVTMEALRELSEQIVDMDIRDVKGDYIMLLRDRRAIENIKPLRRPTVNLLPTLDPYTMGYKNRDRYLDPAYYRYIYDRSGNGAAAILVDGRIAGVWDFAKEPEPVLLLHLFEELPKAASREVYSKAHCLGRFIAGRDYGIKAVDSMEPLTDRAVGGVMSPLRSVLYRTK